jgi:hypothetical protein
MSANIRLAQKACFGEKPAHFCDEVSFSDEEKSFNTIYRRY